ncbi:MAG: hypothetical protein ABIJ46_02445 [bacterium]
MFRDNDSGEVMIHGFEVKARPPRRNRFHRLPVARMFKKMILLYEQYGIVFIVVSDEEVESWEQSRHCPLALG